MKRSMEVDRRTFIGGSDARIIMGSDEAVLVRLWREKRGEVEPEDLSGNLIVQLGTVTEDLNRRWYERNTGHTIKDMQRRIRHPVIGWMAATLDGVVEGSGAVFEAKFMLPWTFSEEGAAEKHTAQVQHNMWVTNATGAVLSIITGGGKWVEIKISADPLYQHLAFDGGEEILALRRDRRGPAYLRDRAASAVHRGGADRRHEFIQRVGRSGGRISHHPPGISRA
jgi:predicted phage-related endonuclease